MKHTPGPWKYEAEVDYGRDIRTEDGKIWLGSALNEHSDLKHFPSSAVCEKNAQLMAASPDLLEALENINKMILNRRNRLKYNPYNLISIIHTTTKQAIKKARGE